MRLRAFAPYSSTSRQWCGRIANAEENAELRWRHRLLFMLVRSYKDQGQFHEGNFRGIACDIFLPHARLVEADALCEAAFPGVVRLPLAVQGGSVLKEQG